MMTTYIDTLLTQLNFFILPMFTSRKTKMGQILWSTSL